MVWAKRILKQIYTFLVAGGKSPSCETSRQEGKIFWFNAWCELTLSTPASLSVCKFSLHYPYKNKLYGNGNKAVDQIQQFY